MELWQYRYVVEPVLLLVLCFSFMDQVSGLGLRVKGSGSRVQLPDRLQLRAPNAPFEHIMRSDDDLHTLVLSTAHHRAHPGSGSRG